VSEFFEVLGHQRACRRFRPDPVDDEAVGRILRAATHAPSAENRQPWVFIVVRDAQRRKAVGDLARLAWEGGAQRYAEQHLPPALLDDVEHGARGGVAGAPVLVVVCADTTRSHPSALAASIFPAVQNLLLAANALGLGSAMTTLPLTAGDAMGTLFELPDHIVAMALVPIGWPERALGPPRRQPLEEKAHREVYGTGW